MARNESWLEQLLATLPSGDARIISPYAHWSVLRRARRRAHRRRYQPTSAEHDRAKIRAATRLLADLAAEKRTLAELDQPWFEHWITTRPSQISLIAGFLVWGRDRSLFAPIEFHRPHAGIPSASTDAARRS
ncbi:hypothetical protein [Allokutzneria albata]|uniref:hypothetical protein n=1 Tax=Allokutzneria albata TaxID=211114 RepID=UPI0012DE04B9|nr:hypothetical protein [Allokutzneria albata]